MAGDQGWRGHCLVAVFLVVLVLFSDAILVAVLCLDKGWILA